MSDGTDLSAVLPTPPYKATINGWPAKVTVKDDGSYTITATIPNYSIEWKK